MRIVFLLLLFSFSIKAQKKANFKSAEKFSQKNLSKMLKSTSVSPKWFKESDKFWYSYTTTSVKNFYIVDPTKRSKSKLFDNLEFAAKLSDLTRKPINHNDLELEEVELDKDNRTLRFHIDSIGYKYDIYDKSIVIGDTISEEDQLYNYDVCYSDGNYDFGSTFNLGDFSGNIILISMNATW